jgi:prepilin-type N-terminal cleavage/methylation domain-containing protein
MISRILKPILDRALNRWAGGLRAARRPPSDAQGFTLVEVLVASMVLVIGMLGLLGVVVVATKTTGTNRVRQAATSLAREVAENTRTLGYTQLTPTTIAAALVSKIPGASLSGSTLSVTRSIYPFSVSFTACSLDDPSDGYGDHTYAPNSGGSWCPDVAAGGTADTNPDDYKRVSVLVTPTGTRTTPTVQQTVLIYPRPTSGPAVTCLTTGTIASNCPGTNQTITAAGTTAVTFNVLTTATAAAIQWLVNGNPPPAAQIPSGATDPYRPAGTTSSFTWALPVADGTYAISSIGFDANGNSGTHSTLQITVNRHQAIAPTTLSAGWNAQIVGVDVTWTPSVDQDILYYDVYHKYGANPAVLVAGCTAVVGSSCTDTSRTSAPLPNPPALPTCNATPQSYTTANLYWVVGVDTAPAPPPNTPRESTAQSPNMDAYLCDHPPKAPTGLTGSLSGGVFNLSWTAPTAPVDPDTGDSIQAWRIYRWPVGQSIQFPASRLQLVGALNGTGGSVTTAPDGSPDPGGVTQNYCVTSVDTHLNESPCSNVVPG